MDEKALPTDRTALAAIFAAAGDGVLLRLRRHVENEGWHLSEQIDRNTGILDIWYGCCIFLLCFVCIC